MNEILIFIIAVVILIINVYFTRWVFRIDELIETQKEQSKLLKIISEKIQKLTNSEIEQLNNLKKNDSIENKNPLEQYRVKSSKIFENKDYCPACQNPLYEFDKKCTNCGLVITE